HFPSRFLCNFVQNPDALRTGTDRHDAINHRTDGLLQLLKQPLRRHVALVIVAVTHDDQDMLFKPGALPEMNGCIPDCVIECRASANARFFKRFLDQTAICAEVLIKVGTVTEIYYKEFVGRIARFDKDFSTLRRLPCGWATLTWSCPRECRSRQRC